MTTIPGTLCTLRPWREEDTEALIWAADDVRVATEMREGFPSPFTIVEARTWIGNTKDQRVIFDFAVEVGGEAAGGVSLRIGDGDHRDFGEITFWLGHDHWGKGIATEAVGAATMYAVTRFDLQRVYALVFAENIGAGRVLEKNGYVLQGRIPEGVPNRGEVRDAVIYALDV